MKTTVEEQTEPKTKFEKHGTASMVVGIFGILPIILLPIIAIILGTVGLSKFEPETVEYKRSQIGITLGYASIGLYLTAAIVLSYINYVMMQL